MDKYIGKKLDGRYEILELVGFGGMAVVFKAYDLLENRHVAVKILKDEYLHNEEFRRRFQEVFGLTRCGDLLRARPGVTERNPASQRLGVTAHCDNMIVTAVEILEQMLQEEPA